MTNTLLKDSKHFCMMPWIHMHFWPNGNVIPCCVADTGLPVGNTNHSSLLEIWNGQSMRELRQRMLADAPSPSCKRCYEQQEAGVYTLRKHANTEFAHHAQRLDSTLADGTVPEINMAYLDVRFSNICNLRCRTCCHDLSSGWYDDWRAMHPEYDQPRLLNINRTGDFWSQLEPYLNQTEEVYFAGGESLMTAEHYRILDHWIATGHTDVRIRYTTNFTVLDYKQRDLFELWKHFSNVSVSASLDASGARAEYLRKNLVWTDIVANRERMMQSVPDVEFRITPTVSLMNVLHLPDFQREWVELGLLQPDKLRLNILDQPEHSSVKSLPAALKDTVRQKIADHLRWLSQHPVDDEQLESWQSVITFMDSADHSHHLKDFYADTAKLDRLRHENFWAVFPELSSLDPAHHTATMCSLPWTNINTTPQGQVKLCCNITHPRDVLMQDGIELNWSKHSIDQIWNGDHMQHTRQQMLAGQPVKGCDVCYKQESIGNQSPRLTALRSADQLVQSYLSTTSDLPTSFELRTSTRCNLSCSSCWAGSSDQIAESRRKSLEWAAHAPQDQWYLAMPDWLRASWAAEQALIQSDSNYANHDTSMSNFAQLAPTLRRLYITGGEPTMDAQVYKYLDALLAAGNTSCHVSFTTNCTLWNPKLMQRLDQFTNTEVQLSVDAHGHANDFIRQGSKWHEVTANVDRYLSETSMTTIKFYTVISALNCLQLAPLLEWIINTVNRHGRRVIWFPIVLEGPSHQRLTVLPSAIRLAAANDLEQQFSMHAWPEHFCDYQHGLRHCLTALRNSETIESNDGIHKLREWLFYDWHMRQRYNHDQPTQYWNFVLPKLAAALNWTEDDWKQHE